MRGFFIFLLVAVGAVLATGFYLGWFAVGTTADPSTGKRGIEFTVDSNKFQQDVQKVTKSSGDALKKPAEPFVTQKVEGMIQKADEAGRLLTIKTRAGAVMTFQVDDNAAIRLRAGNGTWTDLGQGMPVEVHYDTRSGQHHAQTVVVLPPA